jgi:hypothetical protein
LSAIVSVPLSAPLDPGVNVTDTVQLALMARLAPQLSVDAKPPLAAILDTLSAAVPVLLNVTGKDWLVSPTSSVPKVRLLGATAAVGYVLFWLLP